MEEGEVQKEDLRSGWQEHRRCVNIEELVAAEPGAIFLTAGLGRRKT